MKIIARILILLAAAFLVVGGLLLLENRGLLGNLTRGEGGLAGGEGRMRLGLEPGEGRFEGRRQFSEGFQRPEGGFEGRGGHEDRGGGFSAFTWVSLVKNFGIIAAIAVIYALLECFVFRRRRKTAPITL